MRQAQAPASPAGHRWVGALAMLAMLAFGTPMAAIHPNQPQGFDGDRAAQRGLDQIDQVDLFTGRLAVVLPLGPFALVYNSNVWRYEAVLEGGEEHIRSSVDDQNTGGIGWRIGLGEVYRPQHPYNVSGHWLYVSDDGGRHLFYDTLHNDDGNAQAGVWYTRDGSYLRMKKTTSFYVDIESPDGTTRRFLTGAASDPTIFRLHKVWSRFTSADDPDLWVSRDEADLRRTVHDRYGREHHIQLTDEFAPRFPRTVTQLDIEAFEGQRLKYDFEYWNKWVDVSCKQDSPSSPSRIRVPHLKRIDNRGDDTAYTFFEDGELLYYNVCQGGIEDLPGILNGVNLPTGGKIRWAFQEYEFPPAESNSVFNSSAGVASRTLLNADGTPYGGGNSIWTYKTRKLSAAETGGHPEMHTEVVSPTGDCTKHYFDAIYWKSSATGEGWEHGLPFVYSAEVDGRYLSTEVYTANDGNRSCVEEPPIRSTYLRYRRDQTPGPTSPISDWPNLNRQMQASRTIYHDDDDRYADTELSDFDGLGQFRRKVTTATFRSESQDVGQREGFTSFNRVVGTYGTADYQPPAPGDPWVLGIFDYTEVIEPDAVGESTARVEFGFESDTGFLFCTRTLASGPVRATNDVLQVFERDDLGQVTDTKIYGGDQQELATAGAGCGTIPPQPTAWESNTYQYGAITSTSARTPEGESGPFLMRDVDVDPSTGLVVKRRDPSGFEETLDYDLLGRQTSVTPEEGVERNFEHTAASTTRPASVMTRLLSLTDGSVLARQELVFDDFGHRQLERLTMPGGVWSERQISRNARGWTNSISQWGDRDQTTEALDFDPFGRPGIIRPPSGADHDLRLTYEGVRRLTREAKVALSGGESYVTRSFEYDRYQRLRLVEEPSGPDGEMTPTAYDYDVGGRLTRMITNVEPAQIRRFEYDNRGFLLRESHPEKGARGGGSLTYHDHDARGLPGRRVDGPNDLALTYDLMGRLLTVRDRNHENRMLTSFVYDTSDGRGEGKVATATRYNYIDLPWNPQGEELIRVEQTYRYEGLGGTTSSKTTRWLDWDQGTVAFEQGYLYDEMGGVSQLSYPGCTSTACTAGVGTGRQVAYTYDQGLLARVDGWVTEIDYHSSGIWHRIYHANGVVDHQERDPSFTGRPLRLYTSGAQPTSSNFDTGSLAVDGSGSLKSSGEDTFAYDEVGRLVEASFMGGDLVQSYDYDRFGSLIKKTTVDHGSIQTRQYAVDPATNRLSGPVTYDAAGNLTSWQGMEFKYDSSNRLTHQAWMSYLYDASGERVAAIPNTGPGSVTVHFQLRDLGHRIISRFVLNGGEWSRDRDYIYAGDRVLARVEGGAPGVEASYHLHLDHLGTPRMSTRADGSRHFEHFLLPYGEEWTGGGEALHEDPMLFTGHQRDFSVETDYMHARQYFPELGRFMSVDPASGSFEKPQSWNRYTYALASPMTYIDPDGRAAVPYHEAPAFVQPTLFLYTDSWLSLLDKTILYAGGTAGGLAGAVISDLIIEPLRLIPVVGPKLDRKLPGHFAVTGIVYDVLVDGYNEFVGPGSIDNLQGEIDDLVAIVPEYEPIVWIDPDTGEIHIIDRVDAATPRAGLGTFGAEQLCGAQTCIQLPGSVSDSQRDAYEDWVRSRDSVLGLQGFSCMMSGFSCSGIGGGGRPSSSLWLYY